MWPKDKKFKDELNKDVHDLSVLTEIVKTQKE